MLELDCHLSRDGQVVVAHDPHLGRAGSPEMAIAELDYTELPPLRDRIPLDFVFGGSQNEFPRQKLRYDLTANAFVLTFSGSSMIIIKSYYAGIFSYLSPVLCFPGSSLTTSIGKVRSMNFPRVVATKTDM